VPEATLAAVVPFNSGWRSSSGSRLLSVISILQLIRRQKNSLPLVVDVKVGLYHLFAVNCGCGGVKWGTPQNCRNGYKGHKSSAGRLAEGNCSRQHQKCKGFCCCRFY
jgi:hypothetical protein